MNLLWIFRFFKHIYNTKTKSLYIKAFHQMNYSLKEKRKKEQQVQINSDIIGKELLKKHEF